MIAGMLGVHWLLTPLLIGMIEIQMSESWLIPIDYVLSFVFAFISVFSLCALNLIAQEIENPFGDDENDLRCDEAQCHMNEALLLLLSGPADLSPNFSSIHDKKA